LQKVAPARAGRRSRLDRAHYQRTFASFEHRRDRPPRYIGGERNGPPEDCGGIPGFYEWLAAISDPTHEGHAEAKEWADEYDPSTFDELPIKYALSRIANRRNAAKARLASKK